MENFLFKVTFIRNNTEEVLEVLAPDIKTAMNIIYTNHPEYVNFEIDNVESVKV